MSTRYPSPPKPYFKAGNNPLYSEFRVPFKDIKAQNLGDGVSAPTAENCADCGQWDSELKQGNCSECGEEGARFRKGLCTTCKTPAHQVGGFCVDCLTPDAKIARAKREIKAGTRVGVIWVEDMGKSGTFINKAK
jgi:hypothetical protein